MKTTWTYWTPDGEKTVEVEVWVVPDGTLTI